VSVEKGNEYFKIYDAAVDDVDFDGFLWNLSEKNDWEPLAILMDNLSVHKTDRSEKAYEELDIIRIANVSYSPDFNPIEACFSQVKRHFCAERLNILANHNEFDWHKLIKASFKKITPELVEACWRRSFRMLKDFEEAK
jgi:transposase